MWQFIITVREGKPGFADNDEYESEWYDNFEDCYVHYLRFNPEKYWPYLRSSTEIIRYKNKNSIHDNSVDKGLIYYDPEIIEDCLGISEIEFDKIIEKISKNLIPK